MIPPPCLLLGVSRVITNKQQKLLGYLLRPAPMNEHHKVIGCKLVVCGMCGSEKAA